MLQNIRPERYRRLSEARLLSFGFTVHHKSSIPARIDMLKDAPEQVLIELKKTLKLLSQLPDTVEKLNENWAPLLVQKVSFQRWHQILSMATPLRKFMPKAAPFLFDERTEALQGPIVGIQNKLPMAGRTVFHQSNVRGSSAPALKIAQSDKIQRELCLRILATCSSSSKSISASTLASATVKCPQNAPV